PRPEHHQAELVDRHRGLGVGSVQNQTGGFLIEDAALKIQVAPAILKARQLVQVFHGSALRPRDGEEAEAEGLGRADALSESVVKAVWLDDDQYAVEADCTETLSGTRTECPAAGFLVGFNR